MDVIESCLGIVPVPGLALAFKILKSTFASVQGAQCFKEQLTILSASIASILKTLDRQYKDGKLSELSTQKELDDLNDLMREISAFIQKQSTSNFLKLMFIKELTMLSIEGYRSRLDAAINAFQIATLINIQHWQERNEKARISDRASLHARLAQMESNQKLLIEALNTQQSSELALMTTLQRRITDRAPNADPREIEFFSHSLRYLETKTGETVDIQSWTIGPFDVEFGPELGSGGFGRVCKGTWNQMNVALKVMKNSERISPNVAAIRREVDIWSKLQHPHILQFLGANILDDDPFIVMPLIKNGNIRDYILRYPSCDRLKFIYHISLGLVYLHSKNIVHGDLKGVNVLIDDGERALLCDFGLSRIKADVNSRSSADSTCIIGSQNWMAPELFKGGRPKALSDMYSFGMTIYEVYTDDIPLGHLPPSTLREVVTKHDTRPDRPDDTEAPQLTDDVWRLATECWAAQPALRPSASIICDKLKTLHHGQGNPADIRPDHHGQMQPLPTPDPTQSEPHIQPTNNHPPKEYAARAMAPPANLNEKERWRKWFMSNRKASGSQATLPVYSQQDSIIQPTYPVILEPPPAEPRRPSRRNIHVPTNVSDHASPPTPSEGPSNHLYQPSPIHTSASYNSQATTSSQRTRRNIHVPTNVSDHASPPTPSEGPSNHLYQPSPIHTSASYNSQATTSSQRTLLSRFIKDTMEKPPKRSIVLENPAHANCLTQSPDGKDIIVGLTNGYFESWDGNDGSALFPISEDICRPEIGGVITAMGYIKGGSKDARDTSVYLIGSTTGMVAHHPAMGGFTTKLIGNQDPIMCLTENGSEIIVLTKSHQLHTWELRATYNLRRREDRKVSTTPLEVLNKNICTCGAFSPDSTKIFTGTSDGVLLISDVKTGNVLRRQLAFSTNSGASGPTTTIPSCRYLVASPDGRKAAVSYSTGEVRIWDIKSGDYDIVKQGTPNLELHRQHPFPLAYSPDGSKLAFPDMTVGRRNTDKVVEIKDSGSGRQAAVVTLKGCPPSNIQTIDFAVKGKRLILTFQGRKEVFIFVWDS